MAEKVLTLAQKFLTPKELSRKIRTEIRDVARTLKAASANLEMCSKKDSAALLIKFSKNYESDLVRAAAVLNSVASELE